MAVKPKPLPKKSQKLLVGSVVSGSVMVTLAICAAFYLKYYLDQEAKQFRKEMTIRRHHEEFQVFQETMGRVFKNLEMKQYLASYKNLYDLKFPERRDPKMLEEFESVIQRTAEGLIENDFLPEAEVLFARLKEMVIIDEDALAVNIKLIDGKKRFKNGLFYQEQGALLLEQKRYGEAAHEFEKARLEYSAAWNLGVKEAQKAIEDLKVPLDLSRFEERISRTRIFLEDCEKQLTYRNFIKLQAALTKTSKALQKAAVIRPLDPQVKNIRQRLIEMDAEMSYLFPNLKPAWNRFPADKLLDYEEYFYLSQFDFGENPGKDGDLKFKISFQAKSRHKFFIVRYRVHFTDGRSIFNGFKLPAEYSDEQKVMDYMIEEKLSAENQSEAIRQIDLQISDHQDNLVSQVVRAFKKG